VPIGVALDLHGNITPAMVDNADVMVGFKTYPHIDMYETGEHAGRLLFDLLAGRSRPLVRWRGLPLMAHTLRSASFEGAMQRAIEAARAAEASGTLAVSIFAGFSLADIAAPCMSVVVVDTDADAAQAVADRIAASIWAEREAFFYRSEPLAESIARGKVLAEGESRPVLLLDHGDNCMSGGSCDTMGVLQEALAQGLDGIGVGLVCDPDAVAAMFAAGEGATIDVALGNKLSLANIGSHEQPMRLTGKVARLSDGTYVVSGPTYTGQRFNMGRTALFEIAGASIVVTERTHEPWDMGVFECVGLDPRKQRFLILKSRMYCRPVFLPIAAALVECDSLGVTSSDYSRFPFENVRRPVYPFDDMPATLEFGVPA
jgi:microcystin degradation protein MlrC